jgi:predicted nucleotidyltransferase component of viral defense system
MIDIEALTAYYPQQIGGNIAYHKHILKEYVELLAVEYISQSEWAGKLAFIGGTNLRLIQRIDRFSENLDFDCKGLTKEEFMEMTDSVVEQLSSNGLRVEVRDRENPNLTAYRRNIFFPGLLFEMHLTGHREERFLMKVEAQDQGVSYETLSSPVNLCGFMFMTRTPSKSVLLSMKLSALLSRGKGRDFYDTMFLWQQVEPDYYFLKMRCGIGSKQELKQALLEKLRETDLEQKRRDFEHLLFNPRRSGVILHFGAFVEDK